MTKQRGKQSTHAQKLIAESKQLLSKSSISPRTASYNPTLQEFQATSFSDYIRTTVLGVKSSANFADSDAEEEETELLPFSKAQAHPHGIGVPDYDKLNDGVAKITPPEGWWDRAGIGNDTTGRGEIWRAGGKLGDMVIPSPIQQCPSGIGGVYEYTMVIKKPMTIAEFRDVADRYRDQQIGLAKHHKHANVAAEGDDDSKNNLAACKKFNLDCDESEERMDELARLFWRRLSPTMEAAMYGADMEGTLFDGDYASGWNVDQLESCLHLLKADAVLSEEDLKNNSEPFRLPGVTTSYIYVGMWGAVFAAHTEDMNLLSINYLHAGAPKYWYSIAPDDAQRFESLAVSLFPTQASNCPQFLRHKSHLISPTILKKAGIRFKTQVQRAGDAIITFPGSYHFGFNTGFNVAESTNFAVPEWIPYGLNAGVCMCHPHSVRFDVPRFQMLLQEYEKDRDDNDVNDSNDEDGKVLSYNDWATMRAKKWMMEQMIEMEMEQSSMSGKFTTGTAGSDPVRSNSNVAAVTKEEESSSNSSSTVSSSSPLSSSSTTPYSDLMRQQSSPPQKSQSISNAKVSYKDGFLVEVKVQSSSSSLPISPRAGGKGKRGKRLKHKSSTNNKKRTEWRRAIRSTKDTKYHTGKKLLVLLTCFEDDDNDSNDNGDPKSKACSKKRIDRCFSGKVVDVQEEHYIRVHYDGLPRSMDSWVDTRIGGKVFLDGGKVVMDTPEEQEEELWKEQQQAAAAWKNRETENGAKQKKVVVEENAVEKKNHQSAKPNVHKTPQPRGKFLTSKGKPRGKVLAGEDPKAPPIQRHHANANANAAVSKKAKEDENPSNHRNPSSPCPASSSFIQPASVKGKGKVIVQKKPTCVAAGNAGKSSSSNAKKVKCSKTANTKKPKPSPRKPRQPTDIPGVNPYEKSYNNRPTRKRKAICYNENGKKNGEKNKDSRSGSGGDKKSSSIKLNSNVPEWVCTIQSIIDLKEPKVPPHIQPLPRENFKGRRGNAQYRGVCCQKRKGGNRWQSQISFRGHNHYLGTFDTEWLAAAVFAWAHEILNGGPKAEESSTSSSSSSSKETMEKQAAAAVLSASITNTTTNTTRSVPTTTTTNHHHHHHHQDDDIHWSAPTTPCTTLNLNPQQNTNTITSAHYNITDSAITTNVAAAAAGLLMTPLSATSLQQPHPHNHLCHVVVPMQAAGVVSSTGGGVMPQLPMQFLEHSPMSGAL